MIYDGLNVQEAVFKSVEARGYVKGWTEEQFFGRQVCKLLEELGELSRYARLPGLLSGILALGYRARGVFDDRKAWERLGPGAGYAPEMEEELADLQVVLFCAAEAVGRMRGERFDLVEAAMRKAGKDVERLVR